jgi:hypothetical protein
MAVKNFLRGLKKGGKEFGDNIAGIVNSVLLSFVYFFGVGITSIFAKIFNKRFLELKIDKSKKSYWEELNLSKEELERYYKQF